jgi:hypothetical protein
MTFCFKNAKNRTDTLELLGPLRLSFWAESARVEPCLSLTSIIPVRFRDKTDTKSFPFSCILRHFAQSSSSPTGSLSTQPATSKRNAGNANYFLKKTILRRDAIPVRSSKAFANCSQQPRDSSDIDSGSLQQGAASARRLCSNSNVHVNLFFTTIPRWTRRPRDAPSKNLYQDVTATTLKSHA